VVPVYNPGSLIEDCIRSLLDQSLAAGEYEVIFVDDGSTDATPARLDALERDHAHVRVRHIPNSGWPGRPRNIGIEMSRGEFVLFVDNDDWIEREALERMYAMAVRDGADIVIGKVVGHGKPVPPTLFAENRSGVDLEWPPLVWLLTPHRLFRRSLLEQHGLRFPEGRRHLEDHVFVLGALFRTSCVSVLADYPCYHWMLRDRETNASAIEFDPVTYYGNLQEVLDIVDEHTDPGAFRDRLYTRWYRGKVLSRVGGWLFVNREPEARRARFAEIRRLIEQRFPPQLDARLPLSLRVRAQLVRTGTVEQLERLADLETQIEPRAAATAVRCSDDGADLQLQVTLRDPGGLLTFDAAGDALLWHPPELLAGGLPEASLEAAADLDASTAQVLLVGADGGEFLVPADVSTRLVPAAGGPGQMRPVLDVHARVATAAAAAGGRLQPGSYGVRTVSHVAGFRFSAPVTRGPRHVLLVIAVDAHGRASRARASWKQLLAAWVPGLRALVVRAKERLGRR